MKKSSFTISQLTIELLLGTFFGNLFQKCIIGEWYKFWHRNSNYLHPVTDSQSQSEFRWSRDHKVEFTSLYIPIVHKAKFWISTIFLTFSVNTLDITLYSMIGVVGSGKTFVQKKKTTQLCFVPREINEFGQACRR